MSSLHSSLCEVRTLDQASTGGIVTALLRSFPRRSENFHQVQQSVNALPFQTFQEAASIDLNLGLTVQQFENKVLSLTRNFGLGNDTKQSIMDGQYAEVNKEVVKEFLFERGQAGEVT